jgi:hypothetical protein
MDDDRVNKRGWLVFAMLAALSGATLSAQAVEARKDEALAEPRLTLNARFREAIKAAQAATAANDVAAFQAARATATSLVQTADEQYVLARVELDQAQRSADRNGALTALDKLVASGEAAGRLSASDKAALYGAQGEYAYEAQDYPRAERGFMASLAAGNSNPQILIYLADIQASTGRPAPAVANLSKAIALKTAGGQQAPEEWYQRGVDIASRAKLADDFVGMSAAWLAAYPDRTNWYVTLALYRQIAMPVGEASLDLMRLMRAAASTASYAQSDYVAHAQAVYAKYPNEAVSLLREGITADKLKTSDDPAIGRMLAKVDPKIAAERKSMARLDPDKGATSYAAAMTNGDLLSGYGEYAKAAGWYRLALAKSGADDGQANLRLGAALAQAGDKDGARAALAKVTAGSYAPLAAYWRVWVDHPST